MADLRVELYGELVGHLVGAERRTFDFIATKNAIETFGLGSTILSESVPFDLIANRSRAARRRNFFAELLPEGTALDNLAAEIRVSTDDVIPLLAQFGRDVAGAVQIYDPEAPGEPRKPDLAQVDAAGVGRMLANTQAAPLGNRPRSGRTSLSGVQDKIVLARKERHWFQVLEGHPSTQSFAKSRQNLGGASNIMGKVWGPRRGPPYCTLPSADSKPTLPCLRSSKTIQRHKASRESSATSTMASPEMYSMAERSPPTDCV